MRFSDRNEVLGNTKQSLLSEDMEILMPEDYDDTDLNEEEQMFQRTVMLNLISRGFNEVRTVRRSTVGLHGLDTTELNEDNF